MSQVILLLSDTELLFKSLNPPLFVPKHNKTSLSTGKIGQNEDYYFNLSTMSTQKSQLGNSCNPTSEAVIFHLTHDALVPWGL